MAEVASLSSAFFGIQNKLLQHFGLQKLQAGVELEFYLKHKASVPLLNKLQSLPFVYSVKPERGPCQYEITTQVCSSLLKIADITYFLRSMVQKIAQKHCNVAYFSATMGNMLQPSSMQVSFSFVKNGETLGITNPIFYQIMQNIVHQIPNITFLACQTPSCYKRIATNTFTKTFKNCPTHATWGTENRTTAVRAAKLKGGFRLEVRLASPLANPHQLVYALALCAMESSAKHYPQTFIDSFLTQAPRLPNNYFVAQNLFNKSKIATKMYNFYSTYALQKAC